MNTAFATMATTAAKASPPAIRSFGLCNRMRIARLRCSLASIATALAPRRRRGMSSFASILLGTFLHLNHFGLMSASRRRVKRCDIARGLLDRRRECDGQRDGDGGALVDPALHRHLAAMQRDQAFDDRQPEAGALVAPLIGLAGLKERIADPLQVFGRNSDAVIGDAYHQPRSLDAGGHRHCPAALGEFYGIGDK